MLQSDGTYAPAQAAQDPLPATQSVNPTPAQRPAPGSAPAASAQRNNPDADQELDQRQDQQATSQATGSAPQPQQATLPQQPAEPLPAQVPQQPSYPSAGRRPMYNPGSPAYPDYPGYPAPYAGGSYGQPNAPVAGGQPGGETVVIPAGAMVRVRMNRPLSSDRTPPGTAFDGIVANDVVAGNHIAIPRGASVQGTVIDATRSGALKGRGELTIQLTQVTLAGRNYPLVSDVWGTHGRDKTIETVNKTAGFGAVGAVIGALAGGRRWGGGWRRHRRRCWTRLFGRLRGWPGLSSRGGAGHLSHGTASHRNDSLRTGDATSGLRGVPAGADRQGQYRRNYPRVYGGSRLLSVSTRLRPIWIPSVLNARVSTSHHLLREILNG